MDTPEPETSPGQDAGHSAKRRKLRKGTRSCSECKRRKIRCMYGTPGDAACIGCQHRHISCLPQDVDEDPAIVKKDNPRLGDRVARVEDLVTALLTRSQTGQTGQTDGVDTLAWPASPSASRQDSSFCSPETQRDSAASPLITPGSRITSSDTLSLTEADAARHLFAALPVEADIRILLRESSRPSRYTHLISAQPHSKLTLASLAAPYPAMQPPHAGMHPVLLARLMLVFAITLQSPSGEKAEGLSETSEALMHRLVSAARTWVTTKEDLHGSLECLICIVLEGVYETNSGNLRRAWSVFRRAMTVAQLMGLHGSHLPCLLRLDPGDPGLEADAKFLWFRIVSMDRYLSLLLGLPQGCSDKSMADAALLESEPPLGRFERLLAVVACRVLERNETAFAADQLATTQSIDAELLGVARSMPASFWRVPNFYDLRPGRPETLLETVRLAAHVYYYGLLIQLHLPYMMRARVNAESAESAESAAPEQVYAKSTCTNASREILSRFVAHRTFNPTSTCSRPVDFFALLAALTLLLAHLDAHRHQHGHRGPADVLAHQRLSDRAMLEQALDSMDRIKNLNRDPVTGKSAELIRRLMDMEADAADGGTYATSSRDGAAEEVWVSRDGDLRLAIPYLGTITISRLEAADDQARTSATESTLDQSSLCSTLPDAAGTWDGQSGVPPLVAGVDDWTLQGVDMAFFDSLMRGS